MSEVPLCTQWYVPTAVPPDGTASGTVMGFKTPSRGHRWYSKTKPGFLTKSLSLRKVTILVRNQNKTCLICLSWRCIFEIPKCSAAILCTGGADVIRKEAWSFYRTSSGVRLCWELEEPKGPEGIGSSVGVHPCYSKGSDLAGSSIQLLKMQQLASHVAPKIFRLPRMLRWGPRISITA